MNSSNTEFNFLYSFLCPGGDLFDIFLKLDDQEFSYEFPLTCIPVRKSLSSVAGTLRMAEVTPILCHPKSL